MEEVKLRHECIRTLMRGEAIPEPLFIREFCFLQFRMICELVSLGCLVAHEDIEATQSRQVQKLWSAEKIIERLEGLHPDFFPVSFVPKPTGPTASHLGAGPKTALTKAGLLTLYGKCGDVLHRGSRAKLISPRIARHTDFPDIARWANDLLALLDNHIVLMLGGQTVFICEMAAGPNGSVLTQIGVANGPAKFVRSNPESDPPASL